MSEYYGYFCNTSLLIWLLCQILSNKYVNSQVPKNSEHKYMLNCIKYIFSTYYDKYIIFLLFLLLWLLTYLLMLAYPCISTINPTGPIIYSFITNLSNTHLVGDTVPNNAQSVPLWMEFIFQWESWKFIYNFLFLILSLQVCDVFHPLTLNIHSHHL